MASHPRRLHAFERTRPESLRSLSVMRRKEHPILVFPGRDAPSEEESTKAANPIRGVVITATVTDAFRREIEAQVDFGSGPTMSAAARLSKQ